MRLYIVEISKYVIAILSCLFAMCGFIALKFKSEKKRTPIYALQIIMQVIILVLSFITIVLRTGNLNYIFYGIGIVLVLSSLLLLFSAFFPDGNKLIINNAAFLMMTSVIMLMRIDSGKALRQMIIAGVSIVAMFIVCGINKPYVGLCGFGSCFSRNRTSVRFNYQWFIYFFYRLRCYIPAF